MVAKRAVLFDLFNTLTRYEPERIPLVRVRGKERRTTLGVVHRRYRLLGGRADFEPFVDAAFRSYQETRVEAKRDLREISCWDRFRRTLEGLGDDPGPRSGGLALELVNEHMALVIGSATVPASHLEVVDRLRSRFRLGILSNFDHGPAARALLERSGLAERFGVVLISDEEGIRKPHPGLFGRLLERVGVANDEAVYVGDTPGDDVEGARLAGIEPIWLNVDGEVYPGEVAPFTIRRLTEIESLIESGGPIP